MNSIVPKGLFPTASRAVSIATRNIYTKKYLGLEFIKNKEKQAQAKAGKNVIKIKERFMKIYNKEGIKVLKKNEILFFMHFVDGEKDMVNLSKVLEDYLAHAGTNPKDKERIFSACIRTCHLRNDLKYSRLLSEGAFFQAFDKNPQAIQTHFQLLYNHGHYQELVDIFERISKVKNAAHMAIVMAALCRIGTPEAYKKATEIAQDKLSMPEDGRPKELFAWFSIQMGHYDIAIETLKKTKTPSSNVTEILKSVKATSKISLNVVLLALVRSGKVDICLSEMTNVLKNYSKFDFISVYSYELLGEIAKAVKHDEKLTQMYKELPNDLEEKGKMDNATVEELVFRPISVSPHSISSDKSFYNPNSYVDPNRVRKLESKDLFDE